MVEQRNVGGKGWQSGKLVSPQVQLRLVKERHRRSELHGGEEGSGSGAGDRKERCRSLPSVCRREASAKPLVRRSSPGMASVPAPRRTSNA